MTMRRPPATATEYETMRETIVAVGGSSGAASGISPDYSSRRGDCGRAGWGKGKAPTRGAFHTSVDLRGFEPLTSSLRTKRATNCATGPRTSVTLSRPDRPSESTREDGGHEHHLRTTDRHPRHPTPRRRTIRPLFRRRRDHLGGHARVR